MSVAAVISAEKKRIIARLKKAIRPKLRDSAFQDGPIGNSVPLKVCAFKNHRNRDFPKGFVLTSFLGFILEGVITESMGHAIQTTGWNTLPIEDLIRLERHLPKFLSKMR